MPAFLSPVFGAGAQLFTNGGLPLSGGKIYAYLAGSVTPAATYIDSSQGVTNANPIILDSAGRPPQEVWLTGGLQYKFVVTDSAGTPVGYTYDNVGGVNDANYPMSSINEWILGSTPTYIGATQFSVPGNQTATYVVNRRVKASVTAGTAYSSISASSFGAGITTVTVVNDSTPLDSGLSVLQYALISGNPNSLPSSLITSGSMQAQAYTNFTTGGATGAYTLTPLPAIAAYAAGQEFDVTFHTGNAANATIAISGLAAISLVKRTGAGSYANVALGDTPTSWRSKVVVMPGGTTALVREPVALPDGMTVLAPSAGDSSSKVVPSSFVQSAIALAVTSAGAVAAWVSGGTYTLGNVVYSPINFHTYRHTTASSSSTTDPSLDSTNWTDLSSTIGTGGQAITSNITLTAFSSAAITVTPTTPGLYVTLPDATTCSTADNLFSVYNAGDYDYGVKNSAGTQLGWVRARTGAMIGLSDKSTAAGIWAYYGLEKTGITASYINLTLVNMGNTIRRIALDATRTCFLFGGTDCYAIVYDASTQTWGAATLVRASIASGAFLGVLSAANQVLVCSNDSATGMSTVTLTISGTTVTVNAPISTTLAGNWSSYGQLIPVSTSWVLSYGRATNISGIRAISVAGTVPTVGAETAVASSFAIGVTLFASGAVVRTLGWSGSTNINCIPYTLSAGTTLTVGTQATVVVTASPFRAFLNGNGNIVCHYINTTHFATIFKLTGTVEAASSVSLGTSPGSVNSQADYVQVTASKTLFGYHAGSTTFYANLLTDTAGTATAGTEFSLNGFSATLSGLAGLVASGNSARILYGNSTQQIQATFDCSGASPTLSSTVLTFFTSLAIAAVTASDAYGIRAPRLQFAGATVTNVPANNTQTLATVTTANSIRAVVPMMIGISAASGAPTGVVVAANESILANAVSSTNGFTINRIEAAA